MSNVTYVESGAKYSIAMSTLNNVRHWLEKRHSVGLDDKSRGIIIDALKIRDDYKELTSQGETKKKKEGIGYSIKYNMRSFNDKNEAISFQIAEALCALNMPNCVGEKISALEAVIAIKKLDEISSSDMKKAIDLVKDCIWLLGDMNYESLKVSGEIRGAL